MKKIAIIGHFAFGKKMFDGQTIKTITTGEVFKKLYGEENVTCVDTHGRTKTLLKILLKICSVMKRNDEIIMLPAHNGLRIFTPLLSVCNMLFRKKLHYIVIGGWLAEYSDKHKIVQKLLKKNFAGIYVETSVMKKQLEERGFRNIFILPNYKDIEVLDEKDMNFVKDFPVKVCTFSRITPQKGIKDAIDAVVQINEKAGRNILTLDIYGIIDAEFEEEFQLLLKNAPEYISYKGKVDFDKTVGTLRKYDIQLFPTRFKTEGIPGSVVESYFAGTPVISSRWNSFDDVIEEGVTGIGFEFENYDDFVKKLEELACNHEKINQMKSDCLTAAKEYKNDCKKKMELYF